MPLKSQETRANFVHSNWDVKPDETHLLIRAELVVMNFLKRLILYSGGRAPSTQKRAAYATEQKRGSTFQVEI